jgi:DNA glycosylase AlkZ-like
VNSRLRAQQISRHDFDTPAKLVSWLGAVQAQEYPAAKWALGLRLPRGATDQSIENAVSDGSILRTHALRWTWQFVSPDDIRWLIELVRARLNERARKRHGDLGLDAATFRKCNTVIEKAIRDGSNLTRDEIAARLKGARISPAGQRLPHILARAELEGIICSGARKGKHSTYALLDLRVPKSKKRFTREEALAELAHRYFVSRGPATVSDFSWWSGLAPAEARSGVESVKSKLVSKTIDGKSYFSGPSKPARSTKGLAYLLPAFDEYLVAYRNRDAVLDPNVAKRVNAGGGILWPTVVVDGRVVGTWRRVLSRTTVFIEIGLFEKRARAAKDAIADAAARYGTFLGLRPECSFE